jgi:hypothetical protein
MRGSQSIQGPWLECVWRWLGVALPPLQAQREGAAGAEHREAHRTHAGGMLNPEYRLLACRRNMKEEQDLSTEERTAHMKAALYDALHWQRWLNGKADAAAIARRFEPPTSQPWRRRFKCVCLLASRMKSFAAWCLRAVEPPTSQPWRRRFKCVPLCFRSAPHHAHELAFKPYIVHTGLCRACKEGISEHCRERITALTSVLRTPEIAGPSICRAREEGISEHYRERMERVTALMTPSPKP